MSVPRRLVEVAASAAIAFGPAAAHAAETAPEVECFLLLDVASGAVTRGPDRGCDRRVTPASTFKIPHALAALDAGVVAGPEDPRPWDGVERGPAVWNRDHTLATAIRLMAGDPQKWEPETRETADHSMPYTVAVALAHGDVAEEHFDQRHLRDPKLRALTRRVKVSEWDEANRRMPEAMLCRVTLTTTAGTSHASVVDYHRGHWRNPMSDAEVEAKYRRMALARLAAARADELAGRIWRLESMDDAGHILRLTAPE